jgi:hypothetical protein
VTVKTAAPLPECRMCETPTKRDHWEANGQLCTPCADGIAATVRMLPARPGVLSFGEARRRKLLEQRPPALEDPTVFVEGYAPPLPGLDPEIPEVAFGRLYDDEDQP